MSANNHRAAQTVLATYELLERIFLCRPMERVYSFQRTCKAWRDVITRSQDIQKKLFRIADGSPTAPNMPGPFMTPRNLSIPAYDLQDRRCNPNIGLVSLEHKEYKDRYARTMPDLQYTTPARPTTTRLDSSVNRQLGATDLTDLAEKLLGFSMRMDDSVAINSWHEMLVTQPPITAVLFKCYNEEETYRLPRSINQVAPVSHYFHVWNPAGGRFVDLALAQREFAIRNGRAGWKVEMEFDLVGEAVSEGEARDMEEDCVRKYWSGEECVCVKVVKEKSTA